MRTKPIVWTLSLWLLSLCSTALSQSRPPASRGDATLAPQLPATTPVDDSEVHDRMVRDMAKKANQERAAAIKAETEKLLKLAVELKASVDKSNANLLSLDVIRKADEIEKLAHSVKDKMKGPN